jgi:hypothetical protein
MQRNGLLLRGGYIVFYMEELKGAELRRNFELSLSVPISCRTPGVIPPFFRQDIRLAPPEHVSDINSRPETGGDEHTTLPQPRPLNKPN